MPILTQKTISKEINFTGVGIHTGVKTNLKLIPALPNTGVVFKRTDLTKNNILIPKYNNVTNTNLCTTISNNDGVSLSTIEHLMAALYGLGVDNVIVEIDSPEVPILDGSAIEFVNLINSTGLKVSRSPIKLIKINKEISIYDNEKFIEIKKSNVNLTIEFEIKYKNKIINTQKNKIDVYEDDLNHIYESRTFCLYEDIEKLKIMGLGKGGNLQNAVVVDEHEILNKDGLRNKQEFVNHKILDCLGDLYLSGYRIVGKIKCSQGGHNLTNKLLRKIFSDQSNYSLIEIKGQNLPNALSNIEFLKSIA